MIYCD